MMDIDDSRSTAENNHHLDLLNKLKDAVMAGDDTSVEKLLKQEPPLNNQSSGELLWLALTRNEVEIASKLVKARADIKVPSPIDKSEFLLHHLMKRKHSNEDSRYHELAMLIMELGADVNALDGAFMSPLDYAIPFKAPVGLIKELLKRGARVNQQDYIFLMQAGRHPKAAEVVPLLISDEIETRTQQIIDALGYYADMTLKPPAINEEKILSIVQILLEMRNEVVMSDYGILVRAVRTKKVGLVRMLIEYGFDVNRAIIPGGETPLYAASIISRQDKSLDRESLDIMKLLIEAGVKVNGVSGNGIAYTAYPIHAACRIKSLEKIELLLDHGADLRVTDSRGRTPFSVMEISGKIESVHQIVVKRLAVLTMVGQNINESDWKFIQKHRKLHKYFTQCTNELQNV